MRNRFLIISKKELDRFFGDWRIMISALIFPGVMLFLIYSIVVPHVLDLLTGTMTQFRIYIMNPPPVVQVILNYNDVDLICVLENDEEYLKEAISEKTEAFLLAFPPDFSEQIAAYDVNSGKNAPEIRFYYNSLTRGFTEQYGRVVAILNAWESSMVNKFDINRSDEGDLAGMKDRTGNFLSLLLPMFLMVFMFHGAMAVVIGAMTGEKEHGTFAAVLLTSINTRELALGKILGLGIETVLCGISGALGIMLSLPRFINTLNSNLVVNLNFYALSDYGYLLLTLLSVAYLIVVAVSLISIWAKTVKEAQIILAPLVMVVMSIGLLGAVYDNKAPGEWYYCLIPFYNTIQILSSIFNRNYIFTQILLTILSNLFFTIIGIEVLSRLFKNEKIMFNS